MCLLWLTGLEKLKLYLLITMYMCKYALKYKQYVCSHVCVYVSIYINGKNKIMQKVILKNY